MKKATLILTILFFVHLSHPVIASDLYHTNFISSKKTERIEKFFHSKFGQWLIYTVIRMAERKAIRDQKKSEIAKQREKILKEKATSKKKLSPLSWAGLILMIVSLPLFLIGLPLFVIGLILFLVGLITGYSKVRKLDVTPTQEQILKSKESPKKKKLGIATTIGLLLIVFSVVLAVIFSLVGNFVLLNTLAFAAPTFLAGLITLIIGLSQKR